MIDIKKSVNNNKGYSFIETIVAVGIFSFVVLIAGSLMQNVISIQKNSISSQGIQENLRFVLESMSKEMRNARKATSTCSETMPPVYKVYNTNATTSILRFVNKDGLCTYYRLENGRLKIGRGGDNFFASPDEIEVTSLKFWIDDDLWSVFQGRQPRVTILMKMKSGSMETTMQTTISARYYD